MELQDRNLLEPERLTWLDAWILEIRNPEPFERLRRQGYRLNRSEGASGVFFEIIITSLDQFTPRDISIEIEDVLFRFPVKAYIKY